MAGLNKAQILGKLGSDPEVRMTQTGKKVVNFNLATSDKWTDKETGERKERTEWHSIVIFNEKLGAIAEKYLKKGNSVFVEGKLRKNKWTDDKGIERFNTEIVLDAFSGELILVSGNAKRGKTESEGEEESSSESNVLDPDDFR
ncbi:single-stranded DNA-binding protein [Acetobacteraceae bacterium]|nr:single-stranded DNA-binding protein [Acetobacteraceae bacterium]